MARNKELLAIAAKALDDKPGSYRPIQRVEHTDEAVLRTLATNGTVLEPMIGAVIHRAEIPNTVGGVMDAFGLSKDDIHHIACYCHSSDVTNTVAASRIRNLIAQP